MREARLRASEASIGAASVVLEIYAGGHTHRQAQMRIHTDTGTGTHRVCLDNGCAPAHIEAGVHYASDTAGGYLLSPSVIVEPPLTWPTPWAESGWELAIYATAGPLRLGSDQSSHGLAPLENDLLLEWLLPCLVRRLRAPQSCVHSGLDEDVQVSCSLIIISCWLSVLLSGCPIL